ncbi:MAG: hypothetical protein NT075_10765 [Chloroflexi bacterium]|nr:hypothetical protein [Chloroflexota bacterium]
MQSGRSAAQARPLTRREFYQLAERCHAYALELAHYDQGKVNLKQCHEFNRWLAQIKLYDLLTAPLQTLKPARPIARWQLLVIGLVLGLILFVVVSERNTRAWAMSFLYSYSFLLIIFYFVPERFYGTTTELIEGKLLRVVDTLDALLSENKLDFTEAAFFQTKENLEAARRELRQQIDLAHRR